MTQSAAAGGSLADRAYRLIRTMILYQELRPGERTSVADLSAATGLGREPVKAAMNRLAVEKLLIVKGRRGTRVAKLDREQLEQLFEMRRIYEAAAAPLIAQRASDDQIAGIVGLIPRLHDLSTGNSEHASGRDSVVGFIDVDVQFHERIIESTGNPYLLDHYRLLNLHLLISHYIFLDQGLHSSQRHCEHEAIADAVQRRNGKEIAAALANHSNATEAIIVNSMASSRISLSLP